MSASSEHEFESQVSESFLDRYLGDITCIIWKIRMTTRSPKMKINLSSTGN